MVFTYYSINHTVFTFIEHLNYSKPTSLGLCVKHPTIVKIILRNTTPKYRHIFEMLSH